MSRAHEKFVVVFLYWFCKNRFENFLGNFMKKRRQKFGKSKKRLKLVKKVAQSHI